MRFFLVSFFGFSLFERKNVFFSHFYFVYQNKSLKVNIYIYIGYVEYFFNNFSLDNTLSYNSLTGKYLNIKQSFSAIILLFLKQFFKINLKDLYKLNFYFKKLIKKDKYF
jgi:hypothetical protein